MCGILALLHSSMPAADLQVLARQLSLLQKHRGPDFSGCEVRTGSDGLHSCLCHERLAIVGVHSGEQPIISSDGRYILSVNGEIYNHESLRKELRAEYDFQTDSDCEVIIPLIHKYGVHGADRLDGCFTFVCLDTSDMSFIVGRDPIGINPLYWGPMLASSGGGRAIASELKALTAVVETVTIFPPGHVYDSKTDTLQPHYTPRWLMDRTFVPPSAPVDSRLVRTTLETAVQKRMMADVAVGALLSGGLDSSLIAALAARMLREMPSALQTSLTTFSIGLVGSPDLAAAERVAKHIGSEHHSVTFTIDEGIAALRDVIRHVETYDVTTIRASTPMLLLSRYVQKHGIRVLLSGEGADELGAGYLYFSKAPTPAELHHETVRKVAALHQFDCQRANKSTMAHGIEVRVPFLDRDFLDVAMTLDPAAKMSSAKRMEKAFIRDAFAGDDLLPHDVLYRRKEQFSDGVGYAWIDTLKSHAAAHVSDEAMAGAAQRFPINTPSTKEGYYYRTLFVDMFGDGEAAARTVVGGPSIACSTAEVMRWDASFGANADPSGRAIDVHEQHSATMG